MRYVWGGAALGAMFISGPIAALVSGSMVRAMAWMAIAGLFAIASALESRRNP